MSSRPDVLPVERRRSRRRSIPRVPVVLESALNPAGPFVTDALDINCDGLGLVLAPEFQPGTEVLLTFQLDKITAFYRAPSVVLRQEVGVGAVSFAPWPETERSKLFSYLLGD